MRSKRAARLLWVILLAGGLASACGCDQQVRTAIKTGIYTYAGSVSTGVNASLLGDFILSVFTGGLGNTTGGSRLPASTS